MDMIIGQIRYFGASFLCGIGSMFFYDLLLVTRQKHKPGSILRIVEDWLFWSVLAIFVFQMIFALNNGIIRSFFILSFIGGMMGYKKVVKDYVIRAIIAVFTLFSRPYVWFLKKICHLRKKSLK